MTTTTEPNVLFPVDLVSLAKGNDSSLNSVLRAEYGTEGDVVETSNCDDRYESASYCLRLTKEIQSDLQSAYGPVEESTATPKSRADRLRAVMAECNAKSRTDTEGGSDTETMLWDTKEMLVGMLDQIQRRKLSALTEAQEAKKAKDEASRQAQAGSGQVSTLGVVLTVAAAFSLAAGLNYCLSSRTDELE